MDLNSQQRAAVTAVEPAVIVQAGAGSGKTRVVAERVLYYLTCGVRPERVCVLTFTRAAAQELRDRIGAGCWIGTLHSLGLQMLRSIGDQRLVVPAEHRREIVLAALKELGFQKETDLNEAMDAITHQRFTGQENEKLTPLVMKYLRALRDENCLDFDDLITEPVRQAGDINRLWARRFDVVIVDEAQDTAELEWELLARALVGDSELAVTIVGDPQQSIYGFRGVRTFDRSGMLPELLKTDEPVSYLLQTNYRSGAAIVTVANEVTRALPYHLRIEAERDGGMVRGWEHLEDEAAQIADALHDGRVAFTRGTSVAVLCRTNKEAWRFKHAFAARKIVDPDITIGTVHSAKGREWDSVLVTGLTNGRFPLTHADWEEEQRLFYVAVTRARHALLLSGGGLPSPFWVFVRGDGDGGGATHVSVAGNGADRAALGNGHDDPDESAGGGGGAPGGSA
jgi:superfamily I DNA/RNA helicase